jgi:hypothetical protein
LGSIEGERKEVRNIYEILVGRSVVKRYFRIFMHTVKDDIKLPLKQNSLMMMNQKSI